jgi:hypothetical protein
VSFAGKVPEMLTGAQVRVSALKIDTTGHFGQQRDDDVKAPLSPPGLAMLMMLPLIRFVTAVQLVAWQEDWPARR